MDYKDQDLQFAKDIKDTHRLFYVLAVSMLFAFVAK